VLGVVLDAFREDIGAVDFRRCRTRNGGVLSGAAFNNHLDASGRVIRGDNFDLRISSKESLALSERYRVRMNSPNIDQGNSARRDQMVHYSQLLLADDREIVLHQQV